MALLNLAMAYTQIPTITAAILIIQGVGGAGYAMDHDVGSWKKMAFFHGSTFYGLISLKNNTHNFYLLNVDQEE